ncbi:MAG: DNA-directed RNA polymerase sigma-70 factor [Nitrospirales bacterium]|nr:MAG: DNA-directed RNA polymerase sigma-70 factor [Nitrospirales bacterium]
MELYHEYHDELLQFVSRSIKPPLNAHDIVQESFLRLIRHQDIHSITNLKSYIFRIALNLTVDHQRHHTASTKGLQQFKNQEQPRVETRTAESILLAKEELARLHQALTELSPQCQRIFYLNRFAGLKHRAIAEQLHIPIRTVEENIKRALIHSHRRLSQL